MFLRVQRTAAVDKGLSNTREDKTNANANKQTLLIHFRTRLDQHINTHAGFIPNGDGSDVFDPEEAETDANSDPENKQAKTEKEPCSVCKRFIKASSMDGHLNRHKGLGQKPCS